MLPARKHSPWIPDLHRGMMVLAQSGITDTDYFTMGPMKLQREKFYQRVLGDKEPEPFTLMHFALPFAFLSVGIAFAMMSFCREKFKK